MPVYQMRRTVSIPVNLPRERFLPLMGFCAEIFNQHVDWALENKTYNKSRAHKDLYAEARLLYLIVPSALLQAVRDTAMESVKATNRVNITNMQILTRPITFVTAIFSPLPAGQRSRRQSIRQS